MPTPRLLRPTTLEVAILPLAEEEMDHIWRTARRTPQEMIDDPQTPKVRLRAQVQMGRMEYLHITRTGDAEDSDGYFLITARDQALYRLKTNDQVIGLLVSRQWKTVRWLIISVKPVAQYEEFGLWKVNFKEAKRGGE